MIENNVVLPRSRSPATGDLSIIIKFKEGEINAINS